MRIILAINIPLKFILLAKSFFNEKLQLCSIIFFSETGNISLKRYNVLQNYLYFRNSSKLYRSRKFSQIMYRVSALVSKWIFFIFIIVFRIYSDTQYFLIQITISTFLFEKCMNNKHFWKNLPHLMFQPAYVINTKKESYIYLAIIRYYKEFG